MIFLVITWGFDYIVAKFGMYDLTPTSLLFSRIVIGALFVGSIKIARRDWSLIHRRDIPVLIACSLFGEILYFECEFNSMSYLPVSLLTILLAFVPALSVIIERVLFKRKPNAIIVCGIICCIIGIVLVIGADFGILLQGRLIGYLLAFGAVICWNAFNFITEYLDQYDAVSLSFFQLTCAAVLLAPLALHEMVPPTQWPAMLWGIAIYMGVISAGIGFVIVVYAIKVIGPTSTAMYSDFMPVSTAIFGFIFLHESLSPIQIVGGVIVLAAGFVVIREKGKLDEQRQGL